MQMSELQAKSNNNLALCPFCGGEAVKLTSIDGFTSIGCLNCNPFYGVMIQATTEAEAIAAWNSRAERTCKFVSSKGSDYPPVCSACGYELGIYDCEWFEDGTYGYNGNYCPYCGCKVVGE